MTARAPVPAKRSRERSGGVRSGPLVERRRAPRAWAARLLPVGLAVSVSGAAWLGVVANGLAIGGLAATFTGCKRPSTTAPPNLGRCAQCGMRIEASSAFHARITDGLGAERHFDTPKCALAAWRREGQAGAGTGTARLFVQEFYERAWVPAEEVRFVFGSDVLGPMGTDAVPVAPARVEKFMKDHAASHARALGEVTVEDLDQ